MPRLLLIQPTQYGVDGALCKQRRIYLPGLVFPLLAAMTPDRWEVEVKLEVVDDIDYDADVDLVGIGAMGYAIYRGVEIASEFRKRGKTVFMGGYMPSLVPERTLEFADSVVIGDAEISYPKLLDDFGRTGRIEPVYDHPVDDLAGLPLPRYELLTAKPIGDMLPVQAGRGCPNLCSFCSIACIYKGRYVARPLDEVMRDIQRVKELGFKRFYLLDDNIVANRGFLRDLCREIEPLKMGWSSQCSLHLAHDPELLEMVARAGCEILSLGVESVSQEGLDRLGKSWLEVDDHERLIGRLQDAGIMPSTEMMVGTDSDTVESIRATADFIDRTRIPIPRFYILTPMPGTDLYDELRDADRLLTEDHKRYSGSEAVHRPERITPEALTEEYWALYRRVFSWGGILRRTLLNPWFLSRPRLALFAFVVNLHYRHYVMKRVPPNIF